MYFYYYIEGKKYRYTCENNNAIHKLKFICSNSKTPAKAEYSIKGGKFIINEEETKIYIVYNIHCYIIPQNIKQKYENNIFIENNFLEKNNTINKQIPGEYFKYMFVNDIMLKPYICKIYLYKKIS